MDELCFDGPSPRHRWWPEDGIGTPVTTATSPHPLPARPDAEDLTGPADLICAAHRITLQAHQALQTWLLRRADRTGPTDGRVPDTGRNHRARPVPAGHPTVAPDGATEVDPANADPATAVLRTGARALRQAYGPPAPGPQQVSLRWHQEPPCDLTGPDAPTATCTGADSFTVRSRGRLLVEAHGATGPPPAPRESVCPADGWRPPARAVRDGVDRAGLDLLAAGRLADVFGPEHGTADPGGANGLGGPGGYHLLAEVAVAGQGAGRYGLGHLTATAAPGAVSEPVDWAELLPFVWQALRVYALHQGLHLCLPRPYFHPVTHTATQLSVADTRRVAVGPLRLEADVTRIGLVPRPHVVAEVRISDEEGTVAQVREAGVALREAPGADLVPGNAAAPVRRSPGGEPAVVHELHMAHAADGDLAVTYGPAALTSAARVRPRLPRGGMLMLDRMLTIPEARGGYPVGSTHVTEYDVPEAPWYLRDNGGTMPWLFHLESALQAAAFVGAALGASLEHPGEDFTVRNLEGNARLLHPVDLRGRTVRQHTTLLSHTPLPGAILQRYGYELAVDGQVFHRGETVHGFFTRPVLDQQQGLDGGRRVPPWLDNGATSPPGARQLDAGSGAPVGHGRLALLAGATCTLVPESGRHGLGYLLATRPVRSDDWYFGRHFLHDPVMPGSCGIEMLCQAVKFFLLHTGSVSEDSLRTLVPLPGAPLRWTYRGQILPHHAQMRAEVHLREVQRDGAGLTVVADGSVWSDGLRIYEVDTIAFRTSPRSATKEAA
ncbi:3-hydroxyacyl-ACP dehydratase [Streptomyces sp. GS7]|uniref:3-hydroxyacyl-ACP dehydratase n=1 Tax=Streptomyces sp. GS7 TaxID=2692234 RepID=UPI001318EC83|nr:3-hydroxyacyl-ACP dehydratase [Streptomyces sp. GS7]QHC21487.1 3-hydroxyacyl-ACP dehydratase [Streptomyces sp. GS7]